MPVVDGASHKGAEFPHNAAFAGGSMSAADVTLVQDDTYTKNSTQPWDGTFAGGSTYPGDGTYPGVGTSAGVGVPAEVGTLAGGGTYPGNSTSAGVGTPSRDAGGQLVSAVPRPVVGLQRLGEYQGSGSRERKYLIRRADGQVVQLSRLLYLVTEAIDGVRDTMAISHRVSGRFGREISADNVEYLVEHKLQPLGLTVPPGQQDEQSVTAPRSDLLLVLKGHRVIFPERQVARIAGALAWLHRPPVVALVLAALAALDLWLFAFHGAMQPVLQVVEQPVLMLAVFVLIVASLVFHEFGHASACRYGGARPGSIGCGLYLIWPSMYTDVTDVYRINRTGRIRTDLGGVYFNTVFVLGLAGAYFVTGQPFFLAAVYLVHFEILEQLMPALRLDGYYILGDLA
ncbi:hypothetical protein ACFCZX_45045, partial [Streptomyces sp. NPDC056242]